MSANEGFGQVSSDETEAPIGFGLRMGTANYV